MAYRFFLVCVCSLVTIVPDLLAQGCPPPPNLPIGSCAPKSGVAANFAGDAGSTRVRKSIYMLTSAEVTELNLAFKKLRALPSSDPRSWLAQANVHCWYCAGDASNVPDVHTTWAFLPWHRDYLYVLEKTLGSLVGNPKFALPYWDWNTPDKGTCTGHLRVPPPYLGSTNNALFDCYRNVTPTSTMAVASVGAARVDQILNTYNTFPLFFGSATSAAALWPGPHGYVHLFVGNSTNLNIARPDMGVLETAARDPLFWAHHANIDRLWDVWISKYGKPVYPSAFLNQSWTFWDQNKKLVRFTANDAAERSTRLKYRYAQPCGVTALVGEQEEGEAEEELVAITPQPQTFHPEATPPVQNFTIGPTTGTHVIVNLEQVTVPADQVAILRVYVNHPQASAATVEDHRLVQELFIVPGRTPGSGHEGHQHSFNFKVVLPDDVAAEVAAAKGQVPITIVPVASTTEGALAAVPTTIDVKMKKPYITVE